MVLSLFGHLILFYFWFLYLSSKHLSPILRLLIAFWLYSLLALVLSAFVVCGLFYLLLVNSCSLRKYFHWVIFQFKVSASFLLYIWSEFSVQNSDDLLKWFWLTYLIICVFFFFFYWKMGLLHWWTYFWDVCYLDICLFMENIWLIMNLSSHFTHSLPFHTFEMVMLFAFHIENFWVLFSFCCQWWIMFSPVICFSCAHFYYKEKDLFDLKRNQSIHFYYRQKQCCVSECTVGLGNVILKVNQLLTGRKKI